MSSFAGLVVNKDHADVLPTLLELAGATPDQSAFDGASFADVLLGKADSHRRYV